MIIHQAMVEGMHTLYPLQALIYLVKSLGLNSLKDKSSHRV